MKIADMRTKTTKQLDAQADKLRQQIAEGIRDKFTTEKSNHHEIRGWRKQLATVLTVRKEIENSETKVTKEETK